MSVLEMQRLLGKVLTNEDLRNAFLRDPHSVCQTYELTPRERESLSLIDANRFKIYAASLQEGRVSLALVAFPLTKLVLSEEGGPLVARYCKENPPLPVSSSPMFNEAMVFYSFLNKLVATGEMKSKYLRDVLEYEKNLFFIGNDVETSRSSSDFARLNREIIDNLTDEVMLDSKPIKGAHAEVVSFDYDVIELAALLAKQEMPDLETKHTYLLFSKVPNEVGIKTSKINKSTMRLILMCDGTRKTEAILSELARDNGTESKDVVARLTSACLPILRQLCKSSVITFRN
ncbi:MAG: Os1348 family NHLP clan protein [Acidobacteria bacterium]|nr:Os1348 family NHLP clan protein [Acidobacteriota bacterium]